MNDILNLSEPALIALALNALGWVLKTVPKFDNRYIPVTLCLAGLLCYPLLSLPHPFEITHVVRDGIVGFVFGAGSVGFNQLFRQHFGGQTTESNETKTV